MATLTIKDGVGVERTLLTTQIGTDHVPNHLMRGSDGSSNPALKVDSAGVLEVNTELPAPAALADDTSNPTLPGVGAFLLGFDGTAWDRLRVDADTLLRVGLDDGTYRIGAAALNADTSGVAKGLSGINGAFESGSSRGTECPAWLGQSRWSAD
ncbi:MAG: hypothetical protein FJX77_07265 [Armatimonadetes bacterium]|nr:hypothetical protein [Armatimonadota bacterium]